MYWVVFDIILRERQKTSDQKKKNKIWEVCPFKLQSSLWYRKQKIWSIKSWPYCHPNVWSEESPINLLFGLSFWIYDFSIWVMITKVLFCFCFLTYKIFTNFSNFNFKTKGKWLFMWAWQDRTPQKIIQVGYLSLYFLVPLYLILSGNQRGKNNLDMVAP